MGFQISISGSVFAQFDLDVNSYDLLNADYIVGIPITMRTGAFSARLRLYHQSSHLGDEFLLREEDPTFVRENISYESAEDASVARRRTGACIRRWRIPAAP